MSTGQFLLILGIVSVIATYFITKWELEEDSTPSQQPVFHTQTFEEMKKGETFNW